MADTSSVATSKADTKTFEEQQQATAKLFLLNLQTNTSMKQTWQSLLASMKKDIADSKATGAAKTKLYSQKIKKLNDFILSKGYYTSASAVQALVGQQENSWAKQQQSNSQPVTAADEFVSSLLKDTQQLASWQSALSKSVSQDRNAANDYLKSHGITADQVRASFIKARSNNSKHWAGIYGNSVIRFADGKAIHGPVITIYGDDKISVGHTILTKSNNVNYKDGTLTWEKADDPLFGPQHSGKLTFSQISRSAYGDNYIGFELFGTITFPEDASTSYKGQGSIMARVGKPPAIKGKEPGKEHSATPPSLKLQAVNKASQYLGFVNSGMAMVEFVAATPTDVK